MRSLLSALLALVFLVLLTAPMRGEEDRAAYSVTVLADDALDADRLPEHVPFIKPQVAGSVVAERGVDETAAAHLLSPRAATSSLTERPGHQSPTQEPDARRALLRVYRL